MRIGQFAFIYMVSISCTYWFLADQAIQVSVKAYYNAIKSPFAREDLLGDWLIRA
jgi:hypothetical protein